MSKIHHTAKAPMGKEGKIQSMLFKRPKWTVKKAKEWLSKNGYKYDDVDEKEEHLRFRQVSPSYLESKGYIFIQNVASVDDFYIHSDLVNSGQVIISK